MHAETVRLTERELAGHAMRGSDAGFVRLTCDQTSVGTAGTTQLQPIAQNTAATERPLSNQSQRAEVWHGIAHCLRSAVGRHGGERWPRLTGTYLSPRSPAVQNDPFSRSHPFSQSRVS